ncbi:MAG TPA: T9SS type A sorting domain-containing protein [Chitinophagaceae bacterium]
MKKPFIYSVYFKSACLILFSGLLIFFILKYSNNHHIEGRDRDDDEENESPAEVFGSFDMWSNMRSYPDTTWSRAAYFSAFEHSRKLPQLLHAVNGSGARADVLSPWIPLGPKNFSGRILCLGFDPTNANIIFAGSASGGLWKTTTGGTGGVGGISWTEVATGFPILGVPAIAINPQNHLEMYIGTGEVYNSGAVGTGLAGFGISGQNDRTFRGSYGIGILKSTDGGVTWTQSLPFTNSSVKGVQKIIIDPNTPANVFAATSDGVYRSTNSGASWTLIHTVVMAMDMCISPTNADSLYVACGDFGSTGSGIYLIRNATTTPIIAQQTSGLPASASINGMTRLSMCPDNHKIMFASVGKIPGTSGGTAKTTYGLFKTTNGGTTWVAITNQPQLSGSNYIQNQGWYSHDVIVAPTSVNTVYVSEIDMLKSTDGGANFTQVSDWSKWDFNNTTVGATSEGLSTDYVHADQHHLYFGPFDGTYKTVYVVCDGGVFKSTNAGTSFIGLNGGLMTQQIYHNMSISSTNSNVMLCGLQDNATMWYQGNTGCKRVTGGDGFYTAISPTNDSVCFGTYSYLTLYRSTNGIRNLGSTMIFNNPATTTTSVATENACFVAPFVLCPSNPNIMYTGTIYLRRYTAALSANTCTIVNGGNPVSNASAPIICIAVSKTYTDSLYVATCPGGGANPKILRSTNGGTSFTDITGTLPNRYFSYVAVDPLNSKRVAVTVSGFGTSHLYLTNNAGASWVDISGTGATALPDVPANVIMFDDANASVYVGNDLGVYLAQGVTTGATQPAWYAYNTGLIDATMIMDMLVAPNGKIRLGTYGKGLWENDLVNFNLPVTLEDFTASVTTGGNLLKWTVTAQTSVDHYEVEYSTDGLNFNKIASVPPTIGGSDITYTYLHAIRNAVNGYYRIKMVAVDNSFQYSDIREVAAVASAAGFNVYPNPATGPVSVSIPAGSGSAALKLYDAAGKLVLVKQVQLQAAVTTVSMDISRFPSGIYRLICEANKQRWSVSVLKR